MTLLFGNAGAIVLTTFGLLVGGLSLTGISAGVTLHTIGRGADGAPPFLLPARGRMP